MGHLRAGEVILLWGPSKLVGELRVWPLSELSEMVAAELAAASSRPPLPPLPPAVLLSGADWLLARAGAPEHLQILLAAARRCILLTACIQVSAAWVVAAARSSCED